jgi:hypothetical protein
MAAPQCCRDSRKIACLQALGMQIAQLMAVQATRCENTKKPQPYTDKAGKPCIFRCQMTLCHVNEKIYLTRGFGAG